jgi:conjugal transfer pilus assembly protein TraV
MKTTMISNRLSRSFSIAAFSITTLLAGCSSLSGVGGSSSLSCPLPNGALCKPITEVYKMPVGQKGASPEATSSVATNTLAVAQGGAVANGIPLPTAPGLTRYVPSTIASSAETRVTPSSGPPIRSAAKMLRIWLAPYEDDEGALRDHGYMYVMVDPGKWQVEHNQQRIMKQYAPINAPKNTPNSMSKQGADTSATPARSGLPPSPSSANQSSASAFPFLPGNPQPAPSGAGGVYSDQPTQGDPANPLAPVMPVQQ